MSNFITGQQSQLSSNAVLGVGLSAAETQEQKTLREAALIRARNAATCIVIYWESGNSEPKAELHYSGQSMRTNEPLKQLLKVAALWSED